MIDTIIAQATPSGESAISVIRISGPLCHKIAKNACNYENISPRISKLTNYHGIDGKHLDQVIITYFKKGYSYTGQDSLEISLHGNPLLSELVCEDLLKRGCRLALPGEFTKLAFINGKIDLSQAESVAQIISAKNEISLLAAQRNLKGGLSKILLRIQEQILNLQASIEAHIDFPEDDLDTEDKTEQSKLTNTILKELKDLIKQASRTHLLQKNIRVCLFGLPNAGKSSLFNEMIRKKRALVHEKAGTTRDYLEEELKIGKYWITLIDTAGIHNTKNEIEMLGVELSNQQICDADIILWVVDDSVPYPTKLLHKHACMLKDKIYILVKNKIDVGSSQCKALISGASIQKISCEKKIGLNELEDLVEEKISELVGNETDNDLFIGKRHAYLIKQCLHEMNEFQKGLKKEIGFEMITYHLVNARDYIGEMIGLKTNENMLDKLFGQFCIGK